MARSYSLPTIKMLFAEASHCAYPECMEKLVFEDPARGVRSIAVQIAHIRSEKADGPRYDVDYDKTLINTPANLILLCGKHHTAVDQNESTFLTDELLGWQATQRAQGGGTTVSDAELMTMVQTLESSLSALYGLLRVTLEISVVGARVLGYGEVVSMPLEAMDEFNFPAGLDPKKLVGVEIINKSGSGVGISAGLEFDVGNRDANAQWFFSGEFCPPQSPHRLKGHSTQSWLQDVEQIRTVVIEASANRAPIPTRFRAFAIRGDGETEFGEWHDIVKLPIWQPGTTQDWILTLNAARLRS